MGIAKSGVMGLVVLAVLGGCRPRPLLVAARTAVGSDADVAAIPATIAPPSVDQIESAPLPVPVTTSTQRPAAILSNPNPERSEPLPSGLYNPMPGGLTAGYGGDTGLDIAGFKLAVYAIAAGIIVYSEGGHTRWEGTGATPYAVLLKLDEPIPYQKRQITHVWYAHLFDIAYEQGRSSRPRRHVMAGERLGTSGWANGSPHLHVGLLLDNRTWQQWGSYLLEDEIRQVLGGLRHKQRLPRTKR